MKIYLIVACDRNYLIGDNGKIPWKITKDMKFFKERTTGFPIIMGRKTWDSLPKKPLPNRMNIVLSRRYSHEYEKCGAYYASSLSDAIEMASIENKNKIFIIGGLQIYKESLEDGYVDKIIMNRIPGSYEGDVYFPKELLHDWKIVYSYNHSDFTTEIYRNVK